MNFLARFIHSEKKIYEQLKINNIISPRSFFRDHEFSRIFIPKNMSFRKNNDRKTICDFIEKSSGMYFAN